VQIQVLDEPSENWRNIQNALRIGLRGLPGETTLAKFLSEKRGVQNLYGIQNLIVDQILCWADLHQQRTGQWPKVRSGDIADAPGEKWSRIHSALYEGLRGLPGGSSLAKLLAENRPAK
jgi:hypothetical protein